MKISVAPFLGLILVLACVSDCPACATCFTDPEAPITNAVNWMILSLLACLGCVLFSFAAFFIYLIVRSSRDLEPHEMLLLEMNEQGVPHVS